MSADEAAFLACVRQREPGGNYAIVSACATGNHNIGDAFVMIQRGLIHAAVCGGSGSFLLGEAISAGADVFVSADFKYHEFFDAEGKILIADIGHFESEQFTIDLLYNIIREKFPTFALHCAEVNTNPVQYL